MGGVKPREIWDSWKRIIRLAKKPDREEFTLSLKISLLAFFIVGGIAYLIRLVSYLLQPVG